MILCLFVDDVDDGGVALEGVDLENFIFHVTNLTFHILIFKVNEDMYLYFLCMNLLIGETLHVDISYVV